MTKDKQVKMLVEAYLVNVKWIFIEMYKMVDNRDNIRLTGLENLEHFKQDVGYFDRAVDEMLRDLLSIAYESARSVKVIRKYMNKHLVSFVDHFITDAITKLNEIIISEREMCTVSRDSPFDDLHDELTLVNTTLKYKIKNW